MLQRDKDIEITTLKSGIRVILEEIDTHPALSIGVLVKSGSRYENEENLGISHFIEHLIFKGTKDRSAYEISSTIENLGGELNAYTDIHHTFFYTKVLGKHIKEAVDILSDILINPSFKSSHIESEKFVILEEIKEFLDSPQDIVQHNIMNSIFGSHPVVNNPLGKEEIIKSVGKEKISDYFYSFYNPQDFIISIAGDFKKDEALLLIENFFTFDKALYKEKKVETRKPDFVLNENYFKKDTEQIHLAFGLRGFPSYTKESIIMAILNDIFGGDMSSRLFQALREKEGLVYTVYSYPFNFVDSGSLIIYASTSPENFKKVEDIIKKEIDNMHNDGISFDEFAKSKESLEGKLILSLESSFSKMYKNSLEFFAKNKIRTINEIIEEIESITFDEFSTVARYIFDNNFIAKAVVGNIKG